MLTAEPLLRLGGFISIPIENILNYRHINAFKLITENLTLQANDQADSALKLHA